MGTRSDIIVHHRDGNWYRIYCNWDGYLAHNGLVLFEHYTTQAKVERLVALGDLSSLAPKCGKPKGHTFNKKVEGFCVAYGRDRGESDTKAIVAATLDSVWPIDTCTEYTYVWDGGQWWVGEPHHCGNLLLLEDALANKKSVRPTRKAFGLSMRHAI